jgi:hypothetical protein
MKYLSIAFTLLVVTCNVKAQINESDTAKFQLRVNVTGNYQQGNVEVLALKSRIDFSYKPIKNFLFKSQNNSLYQKFYGVEADNDIFSRNFLYYKPTNKVYPFAIGYVSTNYRRKIDTRYFVGVGATYQALNKKTQSIKLSASAVYEESKFNGMLFNNNKYNGNNKIAVWRSTLYMGGWHYLVDKRLRLYYDAFWQPAFEDGNNYRTQVDVGLDFPVWKGLSLNMLYTYTHENVVIEKIKQDDKILTFGLAYNLKVQK